MAGGDALPAKQTGHRRFRRGTIICPVCNAGGAIHGSEHVTELVKTLWVHCTNTTCGMTWRMQLSFEFVVSPSAIERPGLSLPQPPPEFRRQIYPAGPPGPADASDPNQIDMFDEGDGGEGDADQGAEAA